MPVRLVITTYAKPGKGAALAQAMADRCRAVQQEPGCQQFEVFQSALDPDRLVTLELWDDQAALDVHAQVNAARPPVGFGSWLSSWKGWERVGGE
jgi:quinol monooxygenase YgiN